MERITVFRAVAIGSLVVSLQSVAQVTNLTNHVTNNTDYLGSDGTSTNNSLLLKTNNNAHIDFFTNGVNRMRLNKGITTATIGGFGSLTTSAYLALCRNDNLWVNGPGPFSRLHLGDLTQPLYTGGFRDYQINGVTMTGNHDHLYIGQRFESSNDNTTMLFYWSDSLANASYPNVASFVYGETYSGGASAGAPAHYDGREIMRLHPAGYVGLGDWRTAGVQPAERLDLLSGNLRIRALPGTSSTSDSKIMVVDVNGVVHWRPFTDFADCDWFTDIGGTNDTHTAVTGGSACPQSDDNVGIGVIPNSDSGTDMGIKLDVLEDTPTGENALLNVGVRSHVIGDDAGSNIGVLSLADPDGGGAASNIGVKTVANDAETYNTGVDASALLHHVTNFRNVAVKGTAELNEATVTDKNIGVWGIANYADENRGGSFEAKGNSLNTGADVQATSDAGSGSVTNYGVHALAGVSGDGATNDNLAVWATAVGDGYSGMNYGVYGAAYSAPENHAGHFVAVEGSGAAINIGCYAQAANASTDNWAFYSDGESFMSGSGVWQTSDAMFKTDVEDIEDGLSTVMQLKPKRFNFDTATFDYMGFSDKPQFGLIADTSEAVIPDLVREVTRPTEYDSLGQVVHPPITFKAMNYTELIPLLISAVKEQNATITDLQEQVTELQTVVTNCCEGMNGGGQQMAPQGGINGSGGLNANGTLDRANANQQLRIQPNPFSNATTITYTLANAGQVRLIVSTSEGRQLSVLEDQQREAGSFTYNWDTTSLASGVYNVMLLVNGAPMVQRAIKIQR